jgi:hypothetical protein
MLHYLAAVIVLIGTIVSAQDSNVWSCVSLQSSSLLDDAVSWSTMNCTNDPNVAPIQTVNVITIDASASDKVRIIPAVAVNDAKVQSIPDMATQNDKFIAGINGGYFWRVDIDGFWFDDVCREKLRKEANLPANPFTPNTGVSDGLIKVDGKVLGNNCNCTGYSRPAVAILDGKNSAIQVLHRGETVERKVQNAIGAGPNLVSYDSTTGQSFIDIPSDDDNINILEHAANTALAFIFDESNPSVVTKTLLVTTDGSDECGPFQEGCGLNAKNFASFLKDYLKVSVAMSMDQGGSTTMWVKQQAANGRNGVVSRSHNTAPAENDGPRSVANGVFVQLI